MKSESAILNEIRLALSGHGLIFRMQSGNFELKDGRHIVCGIRGMSDLLFIGQGYIAWFEVKNATNKPSPEQINFINVMRSLGHIAGVVRSSEEALKLISPT